MKCSNCGAELREGQKFCGECGTKVEIKKRFCTECGKELPVGATFCPGCGTKVIVENESYQSRNYRESPSQSVFSSYGDYVITGNCVACGTCIDECPVEAIEVGEIYHINANCIDCGECASVCPSEAIVHR